MLRLKELRKNLKLTQNDIAKMLSTTTANVSGWETNKWQPDIESLIKLADIFNCSLDYLVGRELENGIIISNKGFDSETLSFLENYNKLNQNEKNVLYELTSILLKAKN